MRIFDLTHQVVNLKEMSIAIFWRFIISRVPSLLQFSPYESLRMYDITHKTCSIPAK